MKVWVLGREGFCISMACERGNSSAMEFKRSQTNGSGRIQVLDRIFGAGGLIVGLLVDPRNQIWPTRCLLD